MACGGGMSSSQMSSFGALASGFGLGDTFINIATSVANAPVLQVANSALDVAGLAIGDIGANPLTAITSSALSAVSLAPGLNSFLSGGIPSIAQTALGGTDNMMSAMISHVENYMPSDLSSSIQIFDQVDAFSKSGIDIMQSITTGLNTSFGPMTSVIKDFSEGGFMGGTINGYSDILTNGMSSLSSDLPNFGTELSNFGKYGDLGDALNLMKPGQVMNQMLNEGLGEIAGMSNALLDIGVPLDDISNPIYESKILQVMDGITSVTDLADIQSVMESSFSLERLSDVVDITKTIDPNLSKTFTTFTDFGDTLNQLSTGSMANLGSLGTIVSGTATASDLSYLLQETELISQTTFDAVEGVYGGGSGPDGSLLVRDMLGTVASYGHDSYLNTFQDDMNSLHQAGITDTFRDMYSEVEAGVNGDYTSGPNITDPRTTIVYTTLEDFVNAKAAQITAETAVIMASVDTDVQTQLTSAKLNWADSASQINDEITNLAKSNVDTTAVQSGDVQTMLSFASRLGDIGVDENDAADYIERISSADLNGDYIKFSLREGRNIALYNTQEISYPGDISIVGEDTSSFS